MRVLKTIRSKLLVAAALVIMLTVTVQSLAYYRWYITRQQAVMRNHAALATASARAFESYIEEVGNDVESAVLAARAFSPEIWQHLELLRHGHPEIMAAAAIRPSGEVIVVDPKAGPLDLPQGLIARLRAGGLVVSNLSRDPKGRTRFFVLSEVSPEDFGVASLSPDGLGRILNLPTPELRILLVDGAGKLVYDTENPGAARYAEQWPGSLLPIRAAMKGHFVEMKGIRIPGSTGTWIGAAAPIRRTGWTAVVLSATAEAIGPVRQEMRTSATILIIALSLVGALVFYLGRHFTLPVAALSSAADRMRRGELSARVEVKTGDELERMGDAFNRMAENLESTITELRSLQSVLDVAISTLDLDRMLDEMLARVMQTLDAELGAVILVDSDTRRLTLAAIRGVERDGVAAAIEEISPDQGLVGRIISAGQTIYIPDIQGERDLFSPLLSSIGTRSVLATPLRLLDEVIGVIGVGTREVRDFEPRSVRLLEILADRAALAIQNRRLYERQVEQRKRAVFLAEASQLFNSTLRLDEVLNLVVFKCYEFLGDYNLVVFAEEDREELRLAAEYHPDEEFLVRAHEVYKSLPLKRGVGVVGSAIADRRPVLVSDFSASDVPERYKAFAKRLDARAALAVPLIVQEKVIGALLSVVVTEQRTLDHDDLDLATEIAGHAAAAIANANLYREVQNRAEELQTLWEIGQAVTTSIEPETVLSTVAAEVAKLVNADAVSVLLYDDERREMMVRARYGLEMEPEVLRFRPGEGLAGQVTESGTPLAVWDLQDAPDAKYPELARARGLRSGLFVPLMVPGEAIGTINVYSREPRRFDEREIRLVSTFASFAAAAIQNSRLYVRERTIAETLQASFQPSSVEIAGLDLAETYEPGMPEAEVGGDFYDVFELPGGRVGLVIADVSGKGLKAAVYTVMIKYAIRSFAAMDMSPAQVLANVNRVVATYVPVGRFVTVFFGLLEPGSGRMVYCNAGHDLPLFYESEGGFVQTLEVTGPAIGGFTNVEYYEREIQLKEKDAVVLYTDGATDARRDREFLGIEGIQEVVLANASRSSKEIVDSIFQKVSEFGMGKLYDDVTLMAVKLRER